MNGNQESNADSTAPCAALAAAPRWASGKSHEPKQNMKEEQDDEISDRDTMRESGTVSCRRNKIHECH